MCSLKKGVLRNLAEFTGKHLCQSLFFNKLAGLRPAILLKKSLWHKCFPMNFVKFIRTPFLQSTSVWQLLPVEFFLITEELLRLFSDFQFVFIGCLVKNWALLHESIIFYCRFVGGVKKKKFFLLLRFLTSSKPKWNKIFT